MLFPWSLYTLISSFPSLVLSSPAANELGAQISLESHSTTILDVLSADPDYISLLKLLQCARLIPAINRLEGITLFAPTNDAISKRLTWQTALSNSHVLKDNVQEKLRQELSYHLLNTSFHPILLDKKNIETYNTLLYPHNTVNRLLAQPGASEPPWAPASNDTLKGRPQRLRLFSESSLMRVGVDTFGNGGVDVIKGRVNTGNGVVLGIGQVLETPKDLCRSHNVAKHKIHLSSISERCVK